MKTHPKSFFVCIFMFCCTILTLQASEINKVQENKLSDINIAKSAAKMLEKLTKQVQLTADQQSKLFERTEEYLLKRKSILGEKGRSKRELSDEQKNTLIEARKAYKEAINEILTDEQKALAESKKKDQIIDMQNQAQKIIDKKVSSQK